MTVFIALVVDSGRGNCRAGFAGISPRAVFLSAVVWPKMLRIMAGLHQKDSYALFDFGSGTCKARFAAFFLPRAVFLLWFSGPDAQHYGLYEPKGQLRGEILADMVPVVQTAENCRFSAGAVHQGRRQFLRGAEACPHGPFDHTHSPVARG